MEKTPLRTRLAIGATGPERAKAAAFPPLPPPLPAPPLCLSFPLHRSAQSSLRRLGPVCLGSAQFFPPRIGFCRLLPVHAGRSLGPTLLAPPTARSASYPPPLAVAFRAHQQVCGSSSHYFPPPFPPPLFPFLLLSLLLNVNLPWCGWAWCHSCPEVSGPARCFFNCLAFRFCDLKRPVYVPPGARPPNSSGSSFEKVSLGCLWSGQPGSILTYGFPRLSEPGAGLSPLR